MASGCVVVTVCGDCVAIKLWNPASFDLCCSDLPGMNLPREFSGLASHPIYRQDAIAHLNTTRSSKYSTIIFCSRSLLYFVPQESFTAWTNWTIKFKIWTWRESWYKIIWSHSSKQSSHSISISSSISGIINSINSSISISISISTSNQSKEQINAQNMKKWVADDVYWSIMATRTPVGVNKDINQLIDVQIRLNILLIAHYFEN